MDMYVHNAMLLSQLAAHKARTGDAQGAAMLAHVSPIAWQHINFHHLRGYSKISRLAVERFSERHQSQIMSGWRGA